MVAIAPPPTTQRHYHYAAEKYWFYKFAQINHDSPCFLFGVLFKFICHSPSFEYTLPVS